MRAPKKVREQSAQISPELAAEKDRVSRMFNLRGEQSEEYLDAAKAINQKLRNAGLEALCLVEKNR